MVGGGKVGSANAPTGTAIASGTAATGQKTVAPQSGQKQCVRSSPSSEMRTYSAYRPATRTRSAGNRAWIPNALPVRRWQARQWHMEIRIGSPSAVRVSCPQLQEASRTLVARRRRLLFGPALHQRRGLHPLLGALQVEGTVHERHVREGLREVAELAAELRVVLLGEQAEVGAEREEPLEELPRLVEPALEREVVDEPEGARQEGSFAGRQAVDRHRLLVRLVALDEAVADELALDRRHRADHARVVGGEEADERDHEQARVDPLAAVEADEGVELGVEAATEHLVVDLRPHPAPPVDRPAAAEALDRLHAAVERDPRHHLRVREVAPRPAHLPDALVRLLPGMLEVPQEAPLERPGLLGGREIVGSTLVQRVQDLAVDVELELLHRGVPDPDRLRALIAREPGQLEIGEAPLARDAVHDLERGRV